MKRHYLLKEEIPSIGFTPDGDFPLIYAEKAFLETKLHFDSNNNFKLQGGTAYNVVPSFCTYWGPDQEALKKSLQDLHFDFTEDEDSLTVLGKSVHAQVSQEGINAIARMAIALHSIGIYSPSISFITCEIKEDVKAQALFGPIEDEPSGFMTFNIGKINITPEKEELGLDLRIPVTHDPQKIIFRLKDVASQYGSMVYEEQDFNPSLYVPKDSYLIQTLRKTYQDVTGLDSEPRSTGGDTYAKMMKNQGVVFGPRFPHNSGSAHQLDENYSLQDYRKCISIYGRAIYALSR